MRRVHVKCFTCIMALIIIGIGSAPVYSADEVTTKVVGFVKADKDQGFFFYSIPFKEIGTQIQVHALNQDADNDGSLDGFSDGIFSDQNFSIDDRISKFNPTTGAFTPPAIFKDIGGVIGWYAQVPPFGFFELSDMTMQDGEGFLVTFAGAPPDNDSSLFLLGEVNEGEVTTPIESGYNLLGNPFPTGLVPDDTFNDNDGVGFSPTAGTASDPINTGDFIRAEYNGATWTKTIVYFDHATLGKGWYQQVPPFGFFEPTTLVLEPGAAFLYFSRNPFTWKQKSPLTE